MKAEIAEMKKQAKNAQGKRVDEKTSALKICVGGNKEKATARCLRFVPRYAIIKAQKSKAVFVWKQRI